MTIGCTYDFRQIVAVFPSSDDTNRMATATFRPTAHQFLSNVGIAGGGLLGGRELLAAAPPVLALTGAVLAALALVLVLVNPARRAPR